MMPMLNPMDLSNRQILVTGASSGIGRGTAIRLSQLGARVILTARRKSQLEETLSMMTGTGHRIETVDLSSVDAIPGWMRTLVTAKDQLHGVVHSAGLQSIQGIRELDNIAINEMMTLNMNAAFALVRGFRHKKVHAEEGSVVFVSSVSGLKGHAGHSLYAATKGALIAATRALATELAREHIRVNCVAPGLVRTGIVDRMQKVLTQEQYQQVLDQHLLGLGSVDDVAYAIAFLLAETGRWVTGTTLVIDGGYTAH